MKLETCKGHCSKCNSCAVDVAHKGVRHYSGIDESSQLCKDCYKILDYFIHNALSAVTVDFLKDEYPKTYRICRNK